MTPAAIRLDEYGFLVVEGARALQFLQGQLTCNVQDATPETVLPGAYCTPKGRVISSFLLWARAPETVLLRMRADLVANTAAVLGRYAALSRVRVSPAAMDCIGLLGSGIATALAGLVPAWPASARAVVGDGERGIVRCDEAGERVEIWVPRADTAALWETLAARVGSAQPAAWRLALIRAGEAEVQHATSDEFLPQMLGYDASGAVSFRKGCYTGQEIIARTHYKGSVKRRLRRLRGTAGSCPAAGAELLQGDTGRAAGKVVESAPDGTGAFEILAVLADDAVEGAPCLLRTPEGAALEVLP
jgi:hypothetical protein